MDWLESTISQCQPRQRLLPRLLSAAPGVDVAAAAVGAVAPVVAVAAAVAHGPPWLVHGLARNVHGIHGSSDSALLRSRSGYCADLAGLGSQLNSLDHFVVTVEYLSISFSSMRAIRFEVLRCIFAVSGAAERTQPLTYRPDWVPTAVGQPPIVEAALVTKAPSYLETDGDKPYRILGSPRLKALAVFCPS